MEKIGLVLEGGGMRGAYTAGALSYLIDKNIKFDYSVGISSGAVHLCSYLLEDKKMLYDISTKYMVGKEFVGINGFLKEGTLVAYNYIFKKLLKEKLNYNTDPIKQLNIECEFGVYDCEKEDIYFYGKDYLDDNLEFLKATCSLPIAGKIVNYKNMKLLDGGIKMMIPIKRSLEKGINKNIVISTKPKGYIRKEANLFMKLLMKFCFRKYKGVYKDYLIRHTRYHEEVDLIEQLEKENKALFIRPSKSIPVKRFSADKSSLNNLYELGRKDMEDNFEKVKNFLNQSI